MENLSVQKEFGWCNVHTLINVFRDEEFKEYLSNDEYKSGDDDNVTEMLQNAGYPDDRVRPIIGVGEHYPPLPKGYINKILSSKTEDKLIDPSLNIKYPIIPYFLTVNVTEKFWHSVALLRCGNEYLYTDPRNKEMIKLNKINEIHSHFNKCIGISRIERKYDDGYKYIILIGENIGYSDYFKNKIK
jgi:hypothetical protein